MNLCDLSPLLPWYRAHARDLPWRHTKDPYRIWVSEIMLQQTRVEAVLPYYRRFLDALPDVAALANAPEMLLLKLWEGLGYYSRVRNMQRAARTVISEHGGEFPRDFDAVRALCGIGDYTAGAICSFAFDLPTPAVDGNVLRVAARLLAYGEDIRKPAAKRALTEAIAAAQPIEAPAAFNQAVMELGATVCVPNGAPHCDRCPLSDRCKAHLSGSETAFPYKSKPAPRRVEERTVLVLREGDRVALRQRPKTGLLAGLFEPICLAGTADLDAVRALCLQNGVEPLRVAPLGDAKHIFSHVEWHMRGFEVILPDGVSKKCPDGVFFALREEIDRRFAIPSAYQAYRAFL